MHFAALARFGESVADPACITQNRGGSRSRCRGECGSRGVQDVLSSTCAPMASPNSIPIGRRHRISRSTGDGETKLAIERRCAGTGRPMTFGPVSLRYFIQCRRSRSGVSIANVPEPETHLVPLVLPAASEKVTHRHLIGATIPTADGTALRDYRSRRDLAEAHLRALEHLLCRAQVPHLKPRGRAEVIRGER